MIERKNKYYKSYKKDFEQKLRKNCTRSKNTIEAINITLLLRKYIKKNKINNLYLIINKKCTNLKIRNNKGKKWIALGKENRAVYQNDFFDFERLGFSILSEDLTSSFFGVVRGAEEDLVIESRSNYMRIN